MRDIVVTAAHMGIGAMDSNAAVPLTTRTFAELKGYVPIHSWVSIDDHSHERQQRDLRAFAKRGGHKIVGVFMETASRVGRWHRNWDPADAKRS